LNTADEFCDPAVILAEQEKHSQPDYQKQGNHRHKNFNHQTSASNKAETRFSVLDAKSVIRCS